MPGYQAAQVSFNLTDFYKTGMAEVFEACRREAGKLGFSVTGSELIGLAPLEALLRAGRFYAPIQTEEYTLVQTAITRLGLNNIRPFSPREKILEYRLADEKISR